MTKVCSCGYKPMPTHHSLTIAISRIPNPDLSQNVYGTVKGKDTNACCKYVSGIIRMSVEAHNSTEMPDLNNKKGETFPLF